MTQEALNTIGGTVVVALTMGAVTWRWLNKTTSALEAVPGLVDAMRKMVDSVKAAHRRLDDHIRESNQRFERHTERITIIETRFDAHDSEQERRDAELGKRLDRFEEKLDLALDMRRREAGAE